MGGIEQNLNSFIVLGLFAILMLILIASACLTIVAFMPKSELPFIYKNTSRLKSFKIVKKICNPLENKLRAYRLYGIAELKKASKNVKSNKAIIFVDKDFYESVNEGDYIEFADKRYPLDLNAWKNLDMISRQNHISNQNNKTSDEENK